MSGIPKLPRINPGTALNNPSLRSILSPERRAELEGVDAGELWSLEEKQCGMPNILSIIHKRIECQ